MTASNEPLSHPDWIACRAIGWRLAEEWGVPESDAEWRTLRWTPAFDGVPTVHLEDVSAIPFVSGVPGVQEYQHRARVRARTGDVYVSATPPAPGYEAYCRDFLGLGAPTLVGAPPAPGADVCAVATSASEGAAFEAIVAEARRAGALAFHPYMAIAPVWRLARRVAEAAGVPTAVLGPPPGALWVANDKARFARVVREAVGAGHLVETRVCTGPGELADALGELAAGCERVGLKRTRCASAMGNRVFESARVRAADRPARVAMAESFLRDTEWDGSEPALAVEWVDAHSSPSAQLWLPLDAPPVCEGVYEQLLEGEERCFLGSRPSTLPAALNGVIAQVSLRVGAALQGMGYVGRCSFDFVVHRDRAGAEVVAFIECNGRWGGTSTPMHLVDRLIPGPRPHYVAQDWMRESLVGWSFERLRAALESELYDPRTGKGRFVLYNVGPLPGRGKFDVIALGSTPQAAWSAVRERLPSLLERG